MAQVQDIAIIGFGEAGQTFASAGAWGRQVKVFDRQTDDAHWRASKRADYDRVGVVGCETHGDAVAGGVLIISLVTADQALAVAETTAQSIREGALYLDLNSVAPSTKLASARAIETAGGHYVDVAVMSPVQPAALNVPLLLSGSQAKKAKDRLSALGFQKLRIIEGQVGRASSIKMIRSVMVKGLEALSAECVLAATKAGVLDEVLTSLDASWSEAAWSDRANYNLDRMMVHGARRSAEMAEVVKTLDDLGTGSAMSRGTFARQAAIGALGQRQPPETLQDKIASILLIGGQA